MAGWLCPLVFRDQKTSMAGSVRLRLEVATGPMIGMRSSSEVSF